MPFEASLRQRVSPLLVGGLRRARTGWASLSTSLLQVICGAGLAIVVARLLKPDEFGAYATLCAIAIVGSMFAQFGLPELLVRETALRAEKTRNDLDAYWRLTDRILTFTTVIASLAACLIAAMMVQRASTIDLTCVAGITISSAMLAARSSGIRVLRSPVAGQALTLLAPLAATLAAIGVLHACRIPMTPTLALLAHLVGYLVCLLAATFIRRQLGAQIRGGIPTDASGRKILKAAAPMAITAGLLSLAAQVDLMMIAFLSGEVDAGIYRVALQGGMIATILSKTLLGVVAARLPALHASRKLDEMARLCRSTSLAITVLSFGVFIVLGMFGAPLIELFFGLGYAGALLPMLIIAAAQIFSAATGTVGTALNMTGHQSINLRLTLVSVGVNIALNGALIPMYGATGAAIASFASLVIWKSLGNIACQRKLGIDLSIAGLLK